MSLLSLHGVTYLKLWLFRATAAPSNLHPHRLTNKTTISAGEISWVPRPIWVPTPQVQGRHGSVMFLMVVVTGCNPRKLGHIMAIYQSHSGLLWRWVATLANKKNNVFWGQQSLYLAANWVFKKLQNPSPPADVDTMQYKIAKSSEISISLVFFRSSKDLSSSEPVALAFFSVLCDVLSRYHQ